MRAVVQRVLQASVSSEGRAMGAIGAGLVVLVGVAADDTFEDVAWLAEKICKLRLFEDADGKMRFALCETSNEALVVSQFTLFASTRKGTKPSWHRAAPPEIAIPLYEEFVCRMESLLQRPVATGQFGAMMHVALVNDGPVTLILDSRLRE